MIGDTGEVPQYQYNGAEKFHPVASADLFGGNDPVKHRNSVVPGLLYQLPSLPCGTYDRFVLCFKGLHDLLDHFYILFCHFFNERHHLTGKSQTLGKVPHSHRDVDRLVPYPFKVHYDLHDRIDETKILAHRLPRCDRIEALLIDLLFFFIYQVVFPDNFFSKYCISRSERADRFFD